MQSIFFFAETIFTRMQDNSNLSWPHKTKTSAKKKYFAINFIHLIHKARHILSTFTNQCHCLNLHSQCLYLPHTPNTPTLFTAIPQHVVILIHCSGYIQHFLQPFTVTSGEMHCCAVNDRHWLNNILYFWVVLRILNTCVLDFCVASLVWSLWARGSFYGFWFVVLSRFYFWVS